MFDEEVLIAKVISARTELDVSSPAELLKLLEGEFEGLTMSQVKKASSKATKRTGPTPAKAAAEPEAAPKVSKRQEKIKAAEEKATLAEIKTAENQMMEAQRRLRAAKDGDAATAITISGTAEQFIQQITQRAIAGTLEEDDRAFLKERIEADIAALEWVKLAQASGALSLAEDVLALGVEVQLARLMEVRGAKDVTAARACYALEVPAPARDAREATTDANADLDARVKAAAALQTGGGDMEAMD